MIVDCTTNYIFRNDDEGDLIKLMEKREEFKKVTSDTNHTMFQLRKSTTIEDGNYIRKLIERG